MIDGFECRGRWWLPTKPEEKVTGTLRYNYNEGSKLDLIGSFENDKASFTLPEPKVILGVSLDGEQVSLHDCFIVEAQTSNLGMLTTSYYANLAFVGAHFDSKEKTRFKKVIVYYSGLDEWLGISGFRFGHNSEEDVVIRYKNPDSIRASIDEMYTVVFDMIRSDSFDRKSVRVEQHPVAKIEATSEESLEKLQQVIQNLQNFLCLAIREPVYILKMQGVSETSPTDITYVKIYYKSPDLSRALKSIFGWDMLFTYQDIREDFEFMLRNWFKRADLLGPVFGLYFGLVYNTNLYLRNQFLSLVHAAEAFHRRIYNGKYLLDSEYDSTVLNLVKNAIPHHLDEDHYESLKNRLKYGNEYSLRTRLRELLNKYGKIVPQLQVNTNGVVNLVVNTRNYLTHYDEKLRGSIAEGKDLLSITRKLKILVEACLVTETGLDGSKINIFFSRHRRIPEEAFWNPG